MATIHDLKATPQNFTASWVDYGVEIGTDGHDRISIWTDLDINDTKNARMRLVGRHTKAGDDYDFLIKTIYDTHISVKNEYLEFATDADGKSVISFELDEIVPFIQVQIQAGTVGATAGQILSSKYSLK